MHRPNRNESCWVTDAVHEPRNTYMYDQTISVELSHSSPRFTQVSWVWRCWLVDPLGHYKHVLRRRAVHNTKSRMYMMFGETIIAEVGGL